MILLCKVLVNRAEDLAQHEQLRDLGVEKLPELEEFWVDRYIDLSLACLLFPNSFEEGEGYGCLCAEYLHDFHYQTNVPFNEFEGFLSAKNRDMLIKYDPENGILLIS